MARVTTSLISAARARSASHNGSSPAYRPRKRGSWKKIVAELEGFPHPWVKYEDLTANSGATRLAYKMEADRFANALEFGCPFWKVRA
jgi:hypothetical protein